MKYVQKIPGIEDLVYAHRGNVVHHCLENYYPDKKMSIPEVKEMFNKEWKKFKLDNSKLKNKKDETWLMILNGINLDLYVTSTELKIYYPDVVAYIDVVNSRDCIISDWKTSTRSEHNEEEYIMQVKFYAWLYYRKFGELPSRTDVKYLKYSGTKAELGCSPTMDDIKEVEKWHKDTRIMMQYYIDNPDKLPPFNTNYFFCPYKHLWNVQEDSIDVKSFIITRYGNYIYVDGLNDFLLNYFADKYSYEKKNAYFIKDKYPNADTTIRLFSKKFKRFPIGFINEVMQSLHDYAVWKNKTPVIKIIDKRYMDKTVIEMPDKLLSGKTLRPYQQEAVDAFVNRKKEGMLEITTGGGKTLVAAEIIRRLRMKTWFIVDKLELLTQAKETFEKNLGLEVGIVGDGKRDIKDINIATIQTVMKILDFSRRFNDVKRQVLNKAWKRYAEANNIIKPEKEKHEEDMTDEEYKLYEKKLDVYKEKQSSFFKSYSFTEDETEYLVKERINIKQDIEEFKDILSECRFLIEDECHKAGAESYYKLGAYMPNTEYRLGITATAFRDDGNDMMMHATLGPILYSLTGQDLIEQGYLMKPQINFFKLSIPKKYITQLENESKNGLLNSEDVYSDFYPNFIVRNKYRNQAIKDICEEYKNETILILVKHIEHGTLLEEMIPGSKYIYGETNKKVREDTLKEFKANKLNVLISTISIFAEGVDIPSLTVIINAAANRGDVKSLQVLGRVLRKDEGKQKALYYDFVDSYTFFGNASKDRMKVFRKEGYKINVFEKDFKEIDSGNYKQTTIN